MFSPIVLQPSTIDQLRTAMLCLTSYQHQMILITFPLQLHIFVSFFLSDNDMMIHHKERSRCIVAVSEPVSNSQVFKCQFCTIEFIFYGWGIDSERLSYKLVESFEVNVLKWDHFKVKFIEFLNILPAFKVIFQTTLSLL